MTTMIDDDKKVKLSVQAVKAHMASKRTAALSQQQQIVEWPTSRPGRFIPSNAAHDPTPRDNHEQKLLEYLFCTVM